MIIESNGGITSNKTDADYTGTTYEELTDEQKEELRAILGDDTASSITSIEKLDAYLSKLVDFGVMKRSDAEELNGNMQTVYIDRNGNLIQGTSQLNSNRDNWNGSIVDWFCRMESDIINQINFLNGNNGCAYSSDGARERLNTVSAMQELIEKLFAEENI